MHRLRKIVPWSGVGCRFLQSSCAARTSFGVAFDIDGVLVRGPDILPGAAESLRMLVDSNVPFVFVTNGGGCTEEEKARELTRRLEVEVVRAMVVLSHSPMRTLSREFSAKKVLVLGSSAKEIAREDLDLGYTITPEEYAAEWPRMFHFTGDRYYIPRHFPERSTHDTPEPVSAIMVLHDPLDWALEAQVVVDALRGGVPPGSGTGLQTPMFISNPDFLFAGAYPEPRFAAGAFADTVRMLYAKRFGTSEPEVTVFGKPTGATFGYAREVLEKRRESMGLRAELERIYMIGDNPTGDIRGANAAGAPWVSNLVRTGIYRDGGKEGDNDSTDPAHFVHDDVRACVEFALRREAGVA